ncbi:MAG: GxxExxY protein [Candidatus Margulisbacteria bacterium]|nr:GxxExxY protein [Candidatus Margulisiibacteriota bacterium]
MPTEKAHGIQIMKMCEAFAEHGLPLMNAADNHGFWEKDSCELLYKNFTYRIRECAFKIYNTLGFGHKELVYQKTIEREFQKKGLKFEPQKHLAIHYNGKVEVELVVPWRFNKIKEDPFRYYNIKNTFKITKVPSIDLLKFGKIGFLLQFFSFAKCACCYMLFKKADVIYSRDALPLFFLSFFKRNLIWEIHVNRFDPIIKRVLKKCKSIIAITQKLKNFYITKGAKANKILVAPDGVDLNEFDIKTSKDEGREKLNLPKNKKIILYSGSFYLYDWKGIDILLDASKYFDDKHLFILVGGTDEEILAIKEKFNLKNVLLIGHQSHSLMPFFLKAADILVLPNKKGNEVSEKYTSPMKLFEYMASKRPIVASDLPSIREILNEDSSVLVDPNNPGALAKGIKKILKDKNLAEKISMQAYSNVQNYSWNKRAEKILESIKF